ncbi:hypothetical protein TNCT_658031 [Trichonephila clavata]|uniref:Uncharacterized protein n=1 Tax=Trichonephila clavata TaxID=2740835 RepID=A0A8X6FL30_TRICU|nr:hypothetical protein TNCT_658031 [Trichonephila clavata]
MLEPVHFATNHRPKTVNMSGRIIDPHLTIPITDDGMEGTSDEDACYHMSYLGAHAKSKENKLRYLKSETELAIRIPSLPKEELERLRLETSVAENELQVILGELALLTCPIVNCPSHHLILDQNAKSKTKKNSNIKLINSTTKIATNTPTENKIKDKSTINSTTEKNKIKRNGQEEFKTPKKFA